MTNLPKEQETPSYSCQQLNLLTPPGLRSGTDSLDLCGVPKIAVALGGICLLSIALYFYFEQSVQPPTFDRAGYLDLAKGFDSKGIDSAGHNIRTFAYPWILSILLRASRFVNLPFSFSLLILQIGCYVLACITTARAMQGGGRRLSASVYILLSCNVFVAPYLSITLTDSLYTCFSLMVLALIMQAESQTALDQHGSFKRLLLICFLTTFSVTLRPAAVWIIIVALACFLQLWISRRERLSNILLAFTFGSLPLLVQIIVNFEQFRSISPFPVMNLGAQQLIWGIENFKYATWSGGADLPPQFFYVSGYSIPSSVKGSPVMWYLEYPYLAIQHLIIKLISAFDFDFILPYPNRIPDRPWLASNFSLSFLYFGLCGIFIHLVTGSLTVLGSRFLPLVILTAWSSVTISSAIELRFVLPMLTYFMVVTCVLIHALVTQRRIRSILSVLGVGLIALPIFFSVANYVREQSPWKRVEAYYAKKP